MPDEILRINIFRSSIHIARLFSEERWSEDEKIYEEVKERQLKWVDEKVNEFLRKFHDRFAEEALRR